MVLRNRKTLRNRNRNHKRSHKRSHNHKRKTLRNRNRKIHGGNTTDPKYTTTDDRFDIPTTDDAYVSIPGATVRVNELPEHMESRAQEPYN
jgi:hypothetical protein